MSGRTTTSPDHMCVVQFQSRSVKVTFPLAESERPLEQQETISNEMLVSEYTPWL